MFIPMHFVITFALLFILMFTRSYISILNWFKCGLDEWGKKSIRVTIAKRMMHTSAETAAVERALNELSERMIDLGYLTRYRHTVDGTDTMTFHPISGTDKYERKV